MYKTITFTKKNESFSFENNPAKKRGTFSLKISQCDESLLKSFENQDENINDV